MKALSSLLFYFDLVCAALVVVPFVVLCKFQALFFLLKLHFFVSEKTVTRPFLCLQFLLCDVMQG